MLSNTPKIVPYKYILFISMFFITIDLAAVSVSYKMVSINKYFYINSAATYIFPLTYCLGDIVTEVYGYNMARNLVWYSLFLQFIFCIFILFAIHLPSPLYWQNSDAYFIVFNSLLRFVFAGTIANIFSNFLNIYLVSKLKIPCEGRLFWARSLLSTITSGFFMSGIIVLMGFTGKNLDFYQSWMMFQSTFSLEVIYALILVIPAAFLTNFLKHQENVDVFDTHTNFNPFLIINR